jgi:hypothetical protein
VYGKPDPDDASTCATSINSTFLNLQFKAANKGAFQTLLEPLFYSIVYVSSILV